MLAGCGESSSAAADAQITKLLPNNTAAIVRIASLDALNRHKRSMSEAMGEADNGMDFRDMLAMSGLPLGNVRLIDSSQPIVVAATAQKATPPAVTVIVPTTDPTKYLESLSEANIAGTVAGNYVAIPVSGKYERSTTPSQLLTKLRQGTVSVHADVELLNNNYKVIINSGLDAFEQMMASQMETADPNIDGEAIAEMYGELGRAIAGSAQTLGFTVDYKSGMLEFDVSIDAREGSSMAGWSSAPTDLTPLARGMTGKGSIEGLFQLDMTKMGPRYAELMRLFTEAYPEELRVTMNELLASYNDIYDQIGSGVALEGDLFGEDGLTMTAQMMPKDPAKLVTLVADVLRSDAMKRLGFVAAAPETSTDGDTKILDLNIAIDSEKLLALTGQPANSKAPGQQQTSEAFKAIFGEGIALRIAHRGDRVVMTFGKGRDQAAKATLEATQGTFSPSLQSAMTRLDGCNPILIERIDFARMMASVMATMVKSGSVGQAPQLPKGASSDMLLFAGIKGNQWRGGFAIDVAGIGETMQAMMPR